ncbi:restriction endonuclease subunit S [Clostridium botulinum]|nr:restriction endonuclease subunit S [Clostridium botulinum]NFR15549.1 restriction endonuclease subunit S [Clostridium botulinum]NFR44855.1 restriction endonuclease subunit S [Clostridium botulinum]NFS51679.1 restriction endonuclease subunit S [Clostridium botulinum]
MINKNNLYDKYKEIDGYGYIQKIPYEWHILPNIAIFDERISKGHLNEELISVTIGRGIIKQSEIENKKDNSNEDKTNYKLVKQGDLAYNKMRMWQGAIGFSKYRGIVSPAYVVLKPKMEINVEYFHYLFRTNYYNNYAKSFSYGLCDDQLNLRYSDFKRMYSIFPPLQTQNKIVAYLNRKSNQANMFIEKQKRLILIMKEQKKSLINKYITKGIDNNTPKKESGISWIGLIPKHWQIKKIKEVVSFVNRGTTPEYIENGSIKVVNQATFSKGYWDESNIRFHKNKQQKKEKGLLKYKDILLASTGGGVLGKVGLFLQQNGDYMADSHVTILRDTKDLFIPEYLYYFLDINYNLIDGSLSQGSTNQTELQREWLRQMYIPYAPIYEQKQIVEYIDSKIQKIDMMIEQAQKEVELTKEYLESTIFHVVTGQLQVE